jgi:hypothetical protein
MEEVKREVHRVKVEASERCERMERDRDSERIQDRRELRETVDLIEKEVRAIIDRETTQIRS